MKKISFIVANFFSDYYRKRYHIDFYKKKKIKIKILNVSKITRPKYFYHFRKKIKTFEEKIIDNNNLERELIKLKKSDLVIVLIGRTICTKKIFNILEKEKIDYSLMFYSSVPLLNRTNYEIVRDIFFHPISGIMHAFRVFKYRRNKFSIKPKNIFYSGRKVYLDSKKEFSNAKFISVPHPDLDSILIDQRKKTKLIKKFCRPVFIKAGIEPSGHYTHSDRLFSPKKFPPERLALDEEKHYAPLRLFFKDFCSVNNSKGVNIAEHPKRQVEYSEDRTNFLKMGSNYFGKTLELTKNSNFAVCLSSTAINFAVLFYKPIMIITNDDFGFFLKRTIKSTAKLFDKKPFNCSREKFDNERYLYEKKINFKKYDQYIKDFIFDKKPSNLSCEILLNFIERKS